MANTYMYNPLVKAAAPTTLLGDLGVNIPKTDEESQLDEQVAQAQQYDDLVGGLGPEKRPLNVLGNSWLRPSTYKKIWDDAKQSAARKRALNAADSTPTLLDTSKRPQGTILRQRRSGEAQDLANIRAAMAAGKSPRPSAETNYMDLVMNPVEAPAAERTPTDYYTMGGVRNALAQEAPGVLTAETMQRMGYAQPQENVTPVDNDTPQHYPGVDNVTTEPYTGDGGASEYARNKIRDNIRKVESKLMYDKLMGGKLNPLNWTYGGTPAQPAPAPAPQGRVGFADDIGNLGLWEAILKHLPGWGKWLGANTMVDGVPNWALGLGGLAAGGLGLAGLNSLLSKSASARAMQAEDPTLMGTVTPARPTITTGNGMSRLMSIISNGCECNCNYGSNMPKSASQDKPNLVTKTTPRSLVPTGPKYGKPTSVDDTAAFNEIPDSTERTARQRDTWRDQQRNAYYERKNNVLKGISGNFPGLNGRMLQIDPEDDSLYYKDKDGYGYEGFVLNDIPDWSETTAAQRDAWRDQRRNATYADVNNTLKGISGKLFGLNGSTYQIDPYDESLYYKDKDGYVYNY